MCVSLPPCRIARSDAQMYIHFYFFTHSLPDEVKERIIASATTKLASMCFCNPDGYICNAILL